MKPARFKHYLTTGELAFEVQRSPRWIRKLESQGKLPAAARYEWKGMSIRLYAPSQVTEIRAIFRRARPGRPKKGD